MNLLGLLSLWPPFTPTATPAPSASASPWVITRRQRHKRERRRRANRIAWPPAVVVPPAPPQPAELRLNILGDVVQVTVLSYLVAPPTIYYHWYLDGVYLGVTTSPTRTFRFGLGEQARLTVFDTQDPAFDPLANAPDDAPARRTLWWIRSLDASTAWYRIEQQTAGGAWLPIARVAADAQAWDYFWLTDRLTDLTQYAWRVTPLDTLDNPGTPAAIAAEMVVRMPDAPNWQTAFDPETLRMTFALN